MGKQERIELPKLQGHHCFACGTDNPKGLNLYFYRMGDSICTDITLDKCQEGWANMAHGGIISTLIDETMSWTIIFFKRLFFVTRKMEIKYVKPVPIGLPLTVKGKLVNSDQYPRIVAIAEIRGRDNGLLVKGSGEFVALPKESLSSVPEGLKEEMAALFERLPQP